MRLSLVFGGALVGFTLAAAASAAPTLTISPTIQRFYQDGSVPNQHAMPASTQGLNFDDCHDNVKIRFTLTMSTVDTSNFSLQAWAGPSDCGPVAARTASTAACWPVSSGNIAQATSRTFDVNVRDIASQIGRTTTGINLTYSPADATVCSSGVTGASAINVYFLLVPSANGDATGANSPFKIKLTGPPAPTVTSVGAGDTLLNVNWKPATDSDTQGFYIFTDPPLSAVSDAGAITTCADAGFSDGGVDDSGNPINIPNDASCTSQTISVADGGSCNTNALVGGTAGSLLKAFSTGSPTGNTSTSLSVTGLTDGVTYNVAVAATDSYGNIGPISSSTPPSTCGVPAPIDDFWKIYRERGGTAGGSCDVSQTEGAPVFGLAMLGLGALWMKRRRK